MVAIGCRTTDKTPSDAVVIGIEQGPLSLDPRLASDAYSSKISGLLHNGLFRLNERLELEPDLIESFETLSSERYRFHLKKNVHFHDGTELKAADVKYTLESVLDEKLASPFRSTMAKIAEITTPSDFVLEVRLKEPFQPFLSALTMGIVPMNGPPELGTGPFRLESFRPQEEIVLSRFSEYKDGPVGVERVIFKVISDDNLRVLSLKNRRVDVLQNNIPPPLLKTLRNEENLLFGTGEGINMTYLGLNLKNPFLAHPDVRRALALAIDRRALIEYRMANLARPATGILAPSHWAYEKDVVSQEYNPQKARQLLEASGFRDPDGVGPAPRYSLVYKTSTKRDRIGLARLIVRYFKEVGVEVKILPLEWGTLFKDVQSGNFDLYCLTWVGVTDPDIYHYAFHSSEMPPVGANRGRYTDPVVDRLTDEGRRVADREGRRAIYSEVQKILARDLPILPLWYEDNYVVFSKRLKGVRLRPNASFDWLINVTKDPL